MKYPYIVNKNGTWYPAGTDVPDDTVSQNENKIFKYTKTDIHRMPIAELKNLASKNDVAEYENMNGADLKKVLIEKLKL